MNTKECTTITKKMAIECVVIVVVLGGLGDHWNFELAFSILARLLIVNLI